MNKKRMDYIQLHNLTCESALVSSYSIETDELISMDMTIDEVENFLSEHYTDADFYMSVNVLQPITAYIRQTEKGTKENYIQEVSHVAVKIDDKTKALMNRLSKMAWSPVHE